MLTAVDSKLEVDQIRSNALNALFNTLLHHVMLGKIRVPLDSVGFTSEAV